MATTPDYDAVQIVITGLDTFDMMFVVGEVLADVVDDVDRDTRSDENAGTLETKIIPAADLAGIDLAKVVKRVKDEAKRVAGEDDFRAKVEIVKYRRVK